MVVSETKVTIESSGISQINKGFNLDHLSVDEIFELRELLDECRREPIDGIYPLMIKRVTAEMYVEEFIDNSVLDDDIDSPIDKIREETIIDIDHEELTDEEKYNRKLDFLNKNSLPMHEVQDKMNDTFTKIVKEAFEKTKNK